MNAEPALCAEILSHANDLFASREPDFNVAAATAAKTKPLEWSAIPTQPLTSLWRLDLDLDGTGRKQVLIYRDMVINSNGNWHYAHVFPSRAAFESAQSRLEELWKNDSQYPPATKPRLGAQQYFPGALSEAGGEVATGDVWAEHALFKWRGRYYFFFGTTAFDRLKSSEARVYRLKANGRVREACRIAIEGTETLEKQFKAAPGVGSLLSTLSTLGSAGVDCGSGHFGLQHETQSSAAESRAAVRPWATSIADNSYYEYDERTRSFLELWSRADPWSRREYQTFLEQVAPAEAGLSLYLKKMFGVPQGQAGDASRTLVRDLIGAHFLLPHGFEADVPSRELYFGRYSLRDALITRDLGKLESMLSANEKSKDLLAGAAANAVEWAHGLDRVLAAGADPNEPNEYGKTPLMTAAHMDRIDSVRALLRSKANVNAQTKDMDIGCGQGFERIGRAALTYAAENGSPIVMRALLDAGADASVKDSKGNGLDFYLAMNPRLSIEEKRLGIAALAGIADRWNGPSFRCDAATTPVEREICKSEVLRVFDLELNRAYAGFHKKYGQAATSEQREWLARRDSTCSKHAEAMECLAEAMRTRIRYLHRRLEE